MLRPHRRLPSLCAILCLFTALAIFGQDLDDVTIKGTVTDRNGLSVPGATVTLTEARTDAVRIAVADQEGRYTFLKVPPGNTR
jgi:protocatechuate 3,4-dioxygenase beta subunit